MDSELIYPSFSPSATAFECSSTTALPGSSSARATIGSASKYDPIGNPSFLSGEPLFASPFVPFAVFTEELRRGFPRRGVPVALEISPHFLGGGNGLDDDAPVLSLLELYAEFARGEGPNDALSTSRRAESAKAVKAEPPSSTSVGTATTVARRRE